MSILSLFYKFKSELVRDELEQGDLIEPTPELRELLEKYHPHYAQHKENKFYTVLTQSCDLVRRNQGYKARYISLAPLRTLRVVIKYEYGDKFSLTDAGEPYASTATKADIERFLERLLNNNESSYFFFFAENSIGVIEPMCALLSLPISLKVEHYDLLLWARVAGIQNIFQAKLGSLLGQMYSRVGTPELRSDELRKRVDEITDTLGLWLGTDELKILNKAIAEFRTQNAGSPVDTNVLRQLIQKLPKKKARLIERVLDVASEVELCSNPSPERRKFRKALEQDGELSQFFRA